jgi:hypothetical protein
VPGCRRAVWRQMPSTEGPPLSFHTEHGSLAKDFAIRFQAGSGRTTHLQPQCCRQLCLDNWQLPRTTYWQDLPEATQGRRIARMNTTTSAIVIRRQCDQPQASWIAVQSGMVDYPGAKKVLG